MALWGCPVPLVPNIRWELGGRRQEGRWKKRRGVWSCCIPLFHFFLIIIFLDDSHFPIFRQKQQVLPKHAIEPMDRQAVSLGVGRSTRETSGQRAPLIGKLLDVGAVRAGEALSKLWRSKKASCG